jgi:bacteriorhodopsin
MLLAFAIVVALMTLFDNDNKLWYVFPINILDTIFFFPSQMYQKRSDQTTYQNAIFFNIFFLLSFFSNKKFEKVILS